MDTSFSFNEYSLKRKGLNLGGKYEVLDPHGGSPLFTVEEKTVIIPPAFTIPIYKGADKACELLTRKDGIKDHRNEETIKTVSLA